jgi:hypothetical protein
MLNREINAIYCENHKKHTNKFSGQNSEFRYLDADGTYTTTGL